MVNDLMKVLGEVPAKHSYLLLQALSVQVARHNKRVQRAAEELDTQTPGPGVPPPDVPQ